MESFLSDWTNLVVELPNAPDARDLSATLVANNVYGPLWGPKISVTFAKTPLAVGDRALRIGVIDSGQGLEAAVIAYVGVVEYQEDEDTGAAIWGNPDWYLEEVIVADWPTETVAELKVSANESGSVTVRFNGTSVPLSVPPGLVPEVFSGGRRVFIESAPYVNGTKRTSIGALNSFTIESGGASASRFWTDFVQSFEEP